MLRNIILTPTQKEYVYELVYQVVYNIVQIPTLTDNKFVDTFCTAMLGAGLMANVLEQGELNVAFIKICVEARQKGMEEFLQSNGFLKPN